MKQQINVFVMKVYLSATQQPAPHWSSPGSEELLLVKSRLRVTAFSNWQHMLIRLQSLYYLCILHVITMWTQTLQI